MTSEEFTRVMAYLISGYAKPLDKTTVHVYLDALIDLPVEVFEIAAKTCLLQQKWFPSVSELRDAAAQAMTGRLRDMPPAEAWAIAWRGIGKVDPEIRDSFERACRDMPPLVVEAIQTMGVVALCMGKEPVSVVRAQFMKVYEQLQARNYRERLLPAALKRDIAALPALTREKVLSIGRAVDE